jgi:hypothetical protein
MAEPPRIAQLVAPRERLAFLDCQSVDLAGPVSALQAWRRLRAQRAPGLGPAIWLRDAISAWFGVARIGGFHGELAGEVRAGDRLDFFLVEFISDAVLTLTARDRHLDVMTCVTMEGRRLTITASVVTHNRFGRVYMLPVAPAHRLIVWYGLRRLRAD